MNLLQMAQQAFNSDFSRRASRFLGESSSSTQLAMTSLLPQVLGSIARKGATPEGSSALLSLIDGANLDAGTLGNIAGLFGDDGAGISALLKQGTNSLVPALFGDGSGSLVNAISTTSGIKSSSATNLVAMVVPLVLTLVKKVVGDKGLDASSLASLLAGQGPNLQAALDSRITGALGFASPAAFVGGIGGQAADAVRRGGAAAAHSAAAATAVAKSGWMRWLPWLFGVAALILLWSMFGGRSATTPTTAPKAAAPAVSPAPAALAGFPAKDHFEIGSAAISTDGNRAFSVAAAAIENDGLKIV